MTTSTGMMTISSSLSPGQHDHGPELTLVPRMCRSVTTTSTGMMNDHGPELTLVPHMCRSVTTTSTGMMTISSSLSLAMTASHDGDALLIVAQPRPVLIVADRHDDYRT